MGTSWDDTRAFLAQGPRPVFIAVLGRIKMVAIAHDP
jgi:hypothetical protein